GFTGEGAGSAGDVNPKGNVRALVALVRPNDVAPADPAGSRTAVANAWNNVTTYYKQASYTATNVQVDMTANWAGLDGTKEDFLKAYNIVWAQFDRLTAQAGQAAVNEVFNLSNYAMFATVLFLKGEFTRAGGGWPRQNFKYNNGKPQGDPNRI